MEKLKFFSSLIICLKIFLAINQGNIVTTCIQKKFDLFIHFKAVNLHCFSAFLAIPPQQFKLVLDSIIWAFKHTMRNVADTGLNILYQLLQVRNAKGDTKNYKTSICYVTANVSLSFSRPIYLSLSSIYLSIFIIYLSSSISSLSLLRSLSVCQTK